MPRARDTKSIAKRIDLHYFKKPHPWRRARLALVLLAVVSAGAWVAYAATRPDGGGAFLYNPGPLTASHASFENNCAACHAGDGKGGFVQSVSDAACMACHEAPAHDENQLLLAAHNAGNPLALAKEVSLAEFLETPKPAPAAAAGAAPAEGEAAAAASTPAGIGDRKIIVSAQCTACHFEHRGHAALAAVSNSHCTQCHQNLTLALQDQGKRQVQQVAVNAFTATGHPSFGRQLAPAPNTSAPAAAGPAWRDPTDLKFNHAYHLKNVKNGALTDNCTACHDNAGPGATLARDASRQPGVPPFEARPDNGWRWPGAADERYMQPVSYERHCMECHRLDLARGVPVPVAHADLSFVRGQLRDLEGTHYSYLAGLPGDRRAEALKGKTPDRWVKDSVAAVEKAVTGEIKGLALSVRTNKVPDEWKPLLEALPGGSAKAWTDANERAALGKFLNDPKNQAALARDPNVLEYLVAYKSTSACVKCHTMDGVVPAAYVHGLTGQKLALAGASPASAAPAGGAAAPAPAGPARRGPGIRTPGANTEAAPATETPAAQPEPQPAAPRPGMRRPGRSPAPAEPAEGAGETATPATDAPATTEGQAPAEAQPEAAPAEPPRRPGMRRPGQRSAADERPGGDVPTGFAAIPEDAALADASDFSQALALLQIRRPGAARRPAQETSEPPAAAETSPPAEASEPPAQPAPAQAEVPAAAEQTTTSPAPAAPAADRFAGLSLLRTKPTGIPDVPRRWFANGEFNHQSHRNLACIDCHVGADTSSLTADVLSPNMDGRMLGLSAEGASALKATQSCIQCHGERQPNVPAALSSCVTCHDYHMHDKEVWPAGRNVPRGGRPAPPAAKLEETTPAEGVPADAASQPAAETADAG